MVDNLDLFENEIEDIKEYSELDLELFNEVLNCTRDVVVSLGSRIHPAEVIDVIEGAVGHLVYGPRELEKEVSAEEAVNMAVSGLGLSSDDMFTETNDDSYIVENTK